jgi:hypothetical protein
MDRLIVKLIGLALLVGGIYFLGKNVFFATSLSFYWRNLPATGSLLCLMGGVMSLIFFPRQAGGLGWGLLAVGILLVFFSGGAYLLPTSLWHFVVSFGAIAAGFKLFTEERVRF